MSLYGYLLMLLKCNCHDHVCDIFMYLRFFLHRKSHSAVLGTALKRLWETKLTMARLCRISLKGIYLKYYIGVMALVTEYNQLPLCLCYLEESKI